MQPSADISTSVNIAHGAPSRRQALSLLLFAATCMAWHGACADDAAPSAAAPLKKLLILDFELLDDQKDDVPFPEGPRRIQEMTERIRQAFIDNRLYDVIDSTPIVGDIAEQTARQSLLDCNGCELDLAAKLGADRVLLGWVQKVSNLILNLNLEVRDAKTGQVVLQKSADLRGNTDLTWRRAADYLIRDMMQKRQANR